MTTASVAYPKLKEVAERAFMALGEGDRLTEYLTKQIVHDPGLLNQAIQLAVANAVRSARLALRADIKTCLEENGQRFLFSDWPMMDGLTRLCKASREQLLEDADRYHRLTLGNARSERFLRSIAIRLQEYEVVHNVLAEDQLRLLWEQSVNS